MKSTKLTLLHLTLLILLIGGATFFINYGAGTTLIAEQVKIEPKPLDLNNMPPVDFHVKLKIDDTPVVDQINGSTVLVEGVLSPISNWTTKVPPEYVARFDGGDLANIIWNKIDHMGIVTPFPWVPVKVPLTITGLLYDETPWEGTGEAKVLIPENPEPPPPPPGPG